METKTRSTSIKGKKVLALIMAVLMLFSTVPATTVTTIAASTPKTTSISKLSGSANSVKITWKKQTTGTNGYQLQYSTSSKFEKNNTTSKTINKNTATYYTVSKLKFNTVYYFRIRTYKAITKSGKTTNTYSEWSAKKNVRTLPTFSNNPYVSVNSNKPSFTTSQKKSNKSYETYGKLDKYGRCTTCVSCIGKDLMPTGKRGEIGMIKPTGWHTVKYDCVDGKYLYNRCHLIGWQLTAENANKRNLITGTRYLNVKGMLPFENMVADYIKETKNHVLYRVTPIFIGKEKVARGVQIEAYSIEDKGKGICFNVYCFNNQPGIIINYETGDSRLASSSNTNSNTGDKNNTVTEKKITYVCNTNTKKFHLSSCSSVKLMSDKNKKTITTTRTALIKDGYSPCGNCHP